MKVALQDHNHNVENLLILLEKSNCKINKDEMNLCQMSVKFFGHMLTNKGLQVNPDKTNAIIIMPPPKNKSYHLLFLGTITNLSRYNQRNIFWEDSQGMK